MTVLRYFESIKQPVKFDSSPITTAYTGKPIQPIVMDFKVFVMLWFNKFGKIIRNKLTLSTLISRELNFRFKSGPMGPSILTSHLCALAIYLNDELCCIFKEYCRKTASVDILKQFQINIDLCTYDADNPPKLIVGKISLASEPAGKTRLFAICNF